MEELLWAARVGGCNCMSNNTQPPGTDAFNTHTHTTHTSPPLSHHPNTILINPDTAPRKMMSTMPPHEGKQNNANGSVDKDASDNDDNDEVALEHCVAPGVLVFSDEVNTKDLGLGRESDTDDA
jgi:hypothetical protein